MYGYIYKISNTKNNKVYIGQTVRTVKARFKEHLKKATERNLQNKKFYAAINSIGKENFSVEVIDSAQDQAELNTKEKY